MWLINPPITCDLKIKVIRSEAQKSIGWKCRLKKQQLPKPKRRWFQLRLRTLLVLVTLASGVSSRVGRLGIGAAAKGEGGDCVGGRSWVVRYILRLESIVVLKRTGGKQQPILYLEKGYIRCSLETR